MTEDEFYNIMIPWARDVAGIPFIRAYENGPRPVGVYGSLNITESNQLVFEHNQFEVLDPETNLDVLESVAAPRQFKMSVNVYRDANCLGLCEKLKASLRSHKTSRDILNNTNNIGFVSASNVRRLPEQIQNKFENRAQFDAIFNVVVCYESSFESIESVTVQGELFKSEELVQNLTVTVGG